ncbi:hypothetical protein ACFYO5_32130 [Streptomyces sp. NPDC006259]|uniref:hypothetical protein n=1 Tax=Streptomyces sp. NPDC006259 TaxID=3364740 RepID=UPI00368D433C
MHYEWHEFLGDFDVPWPTKGDEWISRISNYMTQNCGASGYGSSSGGDLGPFLEFTVTLGSEGERADTRLLLLPQPGDRIQVWACGMDARDIDLIDAFRSAINLATAGIHEPVKSHKWSAVISEAISPYGDQPKRLPRKLSLSRMKLSSTERYFWQLGPTPLPSANSWTSRPSIPILIRGVSTGYDWMHAQRSAAEELGSLVSFLSAIWDTTIELQESPAPLEWGERQLPDQAGWMRAMEPGMMEAPNIEDLDFLEIPDWIHDAWTTMNRRARIKAAVSIYMEALRVEVRHPSLALVAFVAAVESISLSLYHEERCKSCSNHMNIGGKFNETLELATTEWERERLRAAYGNRSNTVHKGRLHGRELTPGAFSFSILSRISNPSLEASDVMIMKNAARKLLIMAMRNQLPSRMHYKNPESSQ